MKSVGQNDALWLVVGLQLSGAMCWCLVGAGLLELRVSVLAEMFLEHAKNTVSLGIETHHGLKEIASVLREMDEGEVGKKVDDGA